MSVWEERPVKDEDHERRLERLEDSLWGAGGANGLRGQFAGLRAKVNLALGLAGGALATLAAPVVARLLSGA